MSAWLCTTHHIDALVEASMPHGGHMLVELKSGLSFSHKTL